MRKSISIAAISSLTLLASLTALPTRSQLPSSSPKPTETPQTSTTPSPQTSTAPSPPSAATGNVLDRIQCSVADIGAGEILVRGNGYYAFNGENGKYQPIGQGYRFLSGPLRGQSMVRYQQGIYPIATSDEGKANYLINNDSSTKACGAGATTTERKPAQR